MDEIDGSWLNDGLALAFVLALLVFGVPAFALLGAVFSAYYGPGAIDWRVLGSTVAAFATIAMWFAETRWARRGGTRAAVVAAVPLLIFGAIGLVMWLAPGIVGMKAGDVGVAPSLMGVIGLGGAAVHGLLAWIAIATAARTEPAVSAATPSSAKRSSKRPKKKAR